MTPVRLALVMVVAAPLVSPAADPPGPKYEGKPLVYWIDRFQKAEKGDDREEAVQAVVAFGPAAAPAVPQLLTMLDDRSDSYREFVVRMLSAVGPAAKGAVPELARRLRDKTAPNPVQVVRALCAIGPDATVALPAVREVYRTTDPWAGQYPVWLRDTVSDLPKLGPDAVPLLADLTGDEREEYAAKAADALGGMGPAAKGAAPKLTAALKHPALKARCEAAVALWKVEASTAGVPVLVAGLDEEEPHNIATAAEALGKIGPAAKAAVPAMKRARERIPSGYRLRRDVEQAITAVGGATESPADPLVPIAFPPPAVAR